MNNNCITTHQNNEEVLTMRQLLDSEQEEIPSLVEPILPACGLAALVGSSDSGKSALLRELSASVVSGRDFLFWKTRPKHRRVLYLSTEDEACAMRTLLRKQNGGWNLSVQEAERMVFLFADEDFLQRIEAQLVFEGADLVVVDSFADVCRGDLTQSNVVRSILGEFARLAKRYNCLVMFLHHTRKEIDSFSPSKHNAVGSQSFEAKMRLVIELRRDPLQPDKVHLCIVKGNYLPSEYKTESFDILFRKDLTFETTPSRTPFESIKTETVSKKTKSESRVPKEPRAKKQLDRIIEMRNEGKSADDIAQELNICRSSVFRLLKERNENGKS